MGVFGDHGEADDDQADGAEDGQAGKDEAEEAEEAFFPGLKQGHDAEGDGDDIEGQEQYDGEAEHRLFGVARVAVQGMSAQVGGGAKQNEHEKADGEGNDKGSDA